MLNVNPSLQTNFRVAVLLGNRSNPFWTEMKNEYEKVANANGMEFVYFQAVVENDRDEQLRELMEILKKPFSAVIINPLSKTALLPGIIKAVTIGILVIDVGAKTDQELVKQFRPMYVPVKTVDFFQQGFLAGSYICKKLKNRGTSKVAIISGRPDSAQSIGRTEGAIHAFNSASFVRLAANESGDFDTDKAGKTALEILKNNPDIAAFFCANDIMAIGAASAIRNAPEYTEKIIVGVDLTEKTREAITKGLINASVAFSTASVAEVIFNVLKNIRKGEEIKIGNGYNVTSKVVDIENINLSMI